MPQTPPQPSGPQLLPLHCGVHAAQCPVASQACPCAAGQAAGAAASVTAARLAHTVCRAPLEPHGLRDEADRVLSRVPAHARAVARLAALRIHVLKGLVAAVAEVRHRIGSEHLMIERYERERVGGSRWRTRMLARGVRGSCWSGIGFVTNGGSHLGPTQSCVRERVGRSPCARAEIL